MQCQKDVKKAASNAVVDWAQKHKEVNVNLLTSMTPTTYKRVPMVKSKEVIGQVRRTHEASRQLSHLLTPTSGATSDTLKPSSLPKEKTFLEVPPSTLEERRSSEPILQSVQDFLSSPKIVTESGIKKDGYVNLFKRRFSYRDINVIAPNTL
jgi:hypothetical protein